VKELSSLQYCLIGMTAFLIFFVCLFPAKVAYNAAQRVGLVLPPMIKISEIDGSVWNGTVKVDVAGLKSNVLNWDLLFSRLLMGGFGVKIKAESTDYSIDGSLSIFLPLPEKSFFPLNAELEIDGYVSGKIIAAVAPQFNAFVEGKVDLDNILIALTSTGVDGAEGHISWPGGEAKANVMGQAMAVQLPALEGELQKNGEKAKFELVKSEDKKPLAEASVDAEGWGAVRVRQRLLDYFVPSQGKDENSFAIEYEQKLF